MTDMKPWYLSRTIWASLVTVLIAGGSLAGIRLDGIDEGALTDTLMQAATAVAGIVAIAGRFAARSRIG
ncbi:MAG: hypothetical protein F9K19_20985 [Rhizobiaceae bacterium]|nr:MAG: hypothetical protein F9K19_20985 [Rhizobiaceae bacterium]CAG0994195.1 hypothetical protein RHIZO_02419 [Rhizobiaceae bacterium]